MAMMGKTNFLRRNIRLILLWPIISLLIAGIGWIFTLDILEKERRVKEEHAIRAAAAIARGYSDHLVRTFQVIDQILQHVRFEWKLSEGKLRLEDSGHSELFPSTPIFNIGIVNRDGKLVTNALGVRQEDVSDRQYFLFHQAGNFDAFYIGGPSIGRTSGNSVVHFSRRITDDDGNFAGVVRASVAPEYLTASYDQVTLGDNGLLAILGNDLVFRASRIGDITYDFDNHAFKKSATSTASAQKLVLAQQGGSSLVAGDEWFIDGRNRYLGWQQVPGYSIIALAGLDEQEAFPGFAETRANTLALATLSSAILAIFTLAAMGLSLRLAWRKHRLELAQSAYRLATEGGSEGFYICRPIRDKSEAITDFEVIDCNQTGADFYERSRDMVKGARLSILHSKDKTDWRERLVRRFLIAVERGVFEDDIEVRFRSRQKRWFRLKLVYSNELLSITTQDITENKEHLFELERRGNNDSLTGLPNRHWMAAYLPDALIRATEEKHRLALLFIDLDGFKYVNDTAGHDSGDELLRNVARRLKVAVRPADHVVRIGGDEFVVVIENVHDRESAAHIAERVLHAFKEKFGLARGVFSVGTSIGISVFPEDGSDMQELLTHADAAMYAVKTSGKMGYRFFDRKYYEWVRAKIDRTAELRHALETDQLILYYQPRVDVTTGATCSMEALVRWAHPTRGILEPIDFIPLAEETGLIVQLGEIVIEKACAQIAYWSARGQELVPVSINVSARQFNESNIADVLEKAIERHGVTPGLVEIELTESSMTSDSEHVSQSLEGIQRLGMTLAVDDFGTGYSSLSQLQRLDFDVLKVDRAFTADLERTKEGTVFFTAIITMAHALGMRVVAEGVETAEQVRRLKSLHCDEIQGYFISMPLPPSETQPILPKCLL